jgi:membrane protein DedA with SNARE-associated domain/membrane-associated phospholipid phosphatase
MKPVWLAAAALLAAFAVWRRRRLEPLVLGGGLVAAVALAVYGTGAVHPPSLDHVLTSVGGTLGEWTYLLVAVLIFAESGAFVGLIVPGETALIVGGVVAGQGKIDVILLIAIAWTCAVAGDLVSLALGRRLGRAFLLRHGPKVGITHERVAQVERFYERRGGTAVFLGRFVGLARAIQPFLAGSSGMPVRRFLPSDVLAAGIMATGFCLLGFLFWHSLDRVLTLAKQGSFALAATIAVLVGIVWLVRWLRAPANRRRLGAWVDAQAGRPLLGPPIRAARAAGRRLAPVGRFAWARLTPGDGLGLELTTLLAVASVGSFVFFGYLIVLHPIGRLTPGDVRAEHWADVLRTHWLTDLSKLLTELGTLPVAGGALAVVAAVLIVRGHRAEGIALLAGIALIFAGVHLTKTLVDRPRPPHPLVDSTGSAYPSGHAAYATCWVAIAVALRHAFARLASQAALLVAGIVLAVIVGLTRIELRVHWFSDVGGGWGLGAFVFALCGMAALSVPRAYAAAAARRRP